MAGAVCTDNEREFGTICGYSMSNLFRITIQNSGEDIAKAAAFGTVSTDHADPKLVLTDPTIAIGASPYHYRIE